MMSESHSHSVLQTLVLVAEMQAGTQAAPEYGDSNCCHKQPFRALQGDERKCLFPS